VLELARAKGLEPRKVASTKGGEYACACPGCGGKDRFRIWPAQKDGAGSWWCRGCDKGGDGVQFLMEFEGKRFPEAMAAVGREMPDKERFAPPSPSRPAPAGRFTPHDPAPPSGVDVGLWRKKADVFVSWAHEKLLKNRDVLAQLEARGIGPAAVKRFVIGYNPGAGGKNAVWRPRESWGLPPEKKADGKLKKLWIPRGIVIPCMDGETVLRLRIRRDDQDLTEKFNARYYVVPGSTMTPMRIDGGTKAFVVVETELDACMIADQVGGVCGVLALGSAAAKPDAAAFTALEKAQCILNALDYDRAGRAAFKWWQDQFKQCKRWPAPEGKDPGEAFAAGEDMRAWIMAGLPPVFSIAAEKFGSVGPSALDRGKKGAADFSKCGKKNEDPAPVAVEETAPSGAEKGCIDTLHDLLRRHPVRIEATEKRLRVIDPPGWRHKHWETAQYISHLVYFTACFEYLMRHPDRMITGGNFKNKKGPANGHNNRH